MRRTIRAATCLALANTVITTTPAFSAPEPRVPDGTTASYLVADSGEVEPGKGEHEQYRSASIVKLLLAIDYLENLGPGTDLPEEDQALLEPMLRSSDDAAASLFWVRGGQARSVASREAATPAPRSRPSDLDLTRRAMHTTGVVDGHDKILAVLTLEPEGTHWNTSAQRITGLPRALDEANGDGSPRRPVGAAALSSSKPRGPPGAGRRSPA